MKKFLFAVLTLTAASASFSSFAAEEVTHVQGLQHIGTVSDSSGALTLSELESNLQAKATSAGASAFRIVAAGGNNALHGTAEIYR